MRIPATLTRFPLVSALLLIASVGALGCGPLDGGGKPGTTSPDEGSPGGATGAGATGGGDALPTGTTPMTNPTLASRCTLGPTIHDIDCEHETGTLAGRQVLW